MALARRVLLLLLIVAVLAVVAVLVLRGMNDGPAGLVPGTGADNDPLVYTPGRERAFAAAAARGHAHVLYAKLPGGASTSALIRARRWRRRRATCCSRRRSSAATT